MCEVKFRGSDRSRSVRSRHWARVFTTAASDRDLTLAAMAELSGLPRARIEKLLSANTDMMLTDVALLMKALAMSGEELAQRLQEEGGPARTRTSSAACAR